MFQYFNCNVFFKHPSAHSNKMFMLHPLQNESIPMAKFYASVADVKIFQCALLMTEFALLCFWIEL